MYGPKTLAWRDDARCANAGVDMFPDEDDVVGVLTAKAVCDECPVRGPCLAAALHYQEWEFGVWGGTTPTERRALRDEARAVGSRHVL